MDPKTFFSNLLGLAFFAFSTILGWSYYGERAIEYLLGIRAVMPYRILFVIAAFLGAFALEFGQAERAGFTAVWALSDVMNGAMAIPNLIGLILLSGVVARGTRAYLARRPRTAGAHTDEGDELGVGS